MKRLFLCPGLTDLFGVVVVLAVIFRPLMGDPGVGWHLLSGRLMIEHGEVLRVDPFLYLTRPWVHNQWLADIIFAWIFSLGSWLALDSVVKALIVLSIFGVLAPLIRRNGNGEVVTFSVIALSTLLVGTQWIMRPVVFSFVLFAVLYHLLWERRVIFVPLVFLFWANCHSGFAMGGILLFLFWVSALVERDRTWLQKLSVAGGLSLLATLCTPYGWKIDGNLVGLVRDEFFMNLNAEWLPPDFWMVFFVPLASTVLLLMVIAARLTTFRFLDFLLIAVFLYLALYSRRSIPFFGIAMSLPLARALTSLSFGRWSVLPRCWKEGNGHARYTFFALAVFLVLSPLRDQTTLAMDPFFPADAVSRLGENTRASEPRIFHTPNWGGYIAFRLWPDVRPFIDDRNELNGREVYEDFLAANGARMNWRAILDKYQFTHLLLEPDSPLRLVIEREHTWHLVFSDEKALLYQRKS